MTGKGKGSKRRPVDSRLRGNDGIHTKCHPPSFPRKLATARGSVPAVAEGTSRQHARWSRLFPSFPRKRESTRNHEWGDFPYKRESTGFTAHGYGKSMTR